MLRNIRQLFSIVIVSQILIAIVMVVTGLPYRLSAVITIALLMLSAIIAMSWTVFLGHRARTQASEIMANVKKAEVEQKLMISKFRVYAQKLGDSKAKEEILEQLNVLESKSGDRGYD